ncbi:MAG TPA: hypothetical protein VGM74_03270 [Burkholderiaceae bacterium]|jgi:hypothetical protein
MNPRPALALMLACSAFAAVPGWAQSASPATMPAPRAKPLTVVTIETAGPNERAEPQVTHSLIEDSGSKIEQLTVRGQVQHVVVTPKVGLKVPYEILQAPEGRNPYNGTGGNVTAAGNRVWNVLKF